MTVSLRIINGRANQNKSEFILDEIKEKLQEDPLGKPIFYIVPEQMTFQQEYALFEDEKINGSIRAQVVSFSRLAWRVLQETGGSTKQFISSTGIQMMLKKVMEQRKEPFLMFQKASDKHGFIEELEGMITEFKRHCITPDILKEQIAFTKDNVNLQHKMVDLHYIYSELQVLLEQHYIDGEDQLQLLVEKIPVTNILQDAEIYIDGFHRFTPKELQIIAELLQVSKRMTIALTMDEKSLQDHITELDLFYQTSTTYESLNNLARELEIEVEPLQSVPLQYEQLANEPLAHIEKHFDDRPAPAWRGEVDPHIKLAEAVHPRAEIEGMIQEILRLVREEGYRYKDIVVFVRDTAEYNDLIQTIFQDYHIPIFIDEKRTMLNHPFIELIRSLFDVIDSNWRYDALFRLLKTGFIPATNKRYPLDIDAIDLLENYVLEFGIRRKSQWLQTEKWTYRRFQGFSTAPQTDEELAMEEKINAYRDQVVQALQNVDETIRKAKTNKARCLSLYEWMEQIHITNQLEGQRAYYDDIGEVEKAREEEQVWDGFIQLLDEMVEMIGDEQMSFSLFEKTFEAGLEALEFSHVPPTMDHIIVGSIDHSRITSKKCAFLLGVNEGFWPMKPAIDGMINENEREYLKQFGMELAASSRRTLLDDQFYMYLAFSMASDYLWVSYVLSNNDGNAKTASPMVQRMHEFFPQLMEPYLLMEPDELQDAARFITTKEKTRAPLTSQLARYLRNYKMEDIWWDVLNWYMEHETKHDTTYKILQSLFYENKVRSLSEETVGKLYPRQVKTSVSRLEMLHRCSYQHFANYSLKLEDRRTYKLDAPDVGQLFHEALKTITEWILEAGKDFATITKDDSNMYARKSMSHLAPALQHHILASSNRYQYIQKKLQDIIAQATFVLSEQARMSGFSPVGLEVGFGFEEGLAPMTVTLPNGYELLLRGRIDRVDKATEQEHLYLRIIDYKSSSRGLDLLDVYYGLALQMLTYLDVVLSQSENWLGKTATAAGVLYFHVHNAMLSESNRIKDDTISDKLFKEYKMAGLVKAEEEIARLMDTTLETGHSDIAPFGIKKDGSFYANSKVVGEETFHLLQNHIHRLIEQAGIDITSGNIELNPYENNQGTACTFCDFKSVCQFDPILAENNYRRLTPLKEKEIISRLREESDEKQV